MKMQKLHIIYFVLVLLWTIGCYIVEKTIDSVPGLFTGLLEVFCEVIILLYLLFGKRPRRSKLASFRLMLIFSFLLLCFGDSSYAILFYVLKSSSITKLAIWTTSFPYALLNFSLLIAIGCFANPSVHIAPKPWPVIVSASVILPVVCKFVLHPFLLNARHMSTLFLIVRLTDILGSFILAIVACSLFLRSRHLCWSMMGAGIIALVFSDWMIQVSTPTGELSPLGLYEFFWAFGVLTVSTVIYLPGVLTVPASSYASELKTLTGIKTALFFMGFLFVVIYSLCSDEDDVATSRIICFGTMISLFMAAFVTHVLIPHQPNRAGFAQSYPRCQTKPFRGDVV